MYLAFLWDYSTLLLYIGSVIILFSSKLLIPITSAFNFIISQISWVFRLIGLIVGDKVNHLQKLD